MSVTEYTPVSFSAGEPLTADKLNALANNVQLLSEKTPKILYSGYGITKDKGVKIFSTIVTFPKSTSWNRHVDVYFGSMFSTACKPIITLGVVTYPQRRMHVSMKGIGTGSLVIPDSRGAGISLDTDEVTTNYRPITNTMYVHVTAVGW